MTSAETLRQLAEWLPERRWFAAKGRPIGRVSVVQSARLRTGEPSAELLVLAVEFADAGPPERYQLLLGHRAELPVELEHVAIGPDGHYDGLWDPELSAELLGALAGGERRDWLRFVPEPGAEIPTGLPGRVLGVEQSNSSVAFGDALLLKLFRRLAPGVNPDLELHRALRSVGSGEVAELLGALEGSLAGEPAVFGIAQAFAANSADGWAMALISIRDLFAEGDLRADEVGGDFSGEAFRLGQTVAVMHGELTRALGTTELDPVDAARGMARRLALSVPAVPELAELAEPLRAAFDAVAELPGPLPAQRVHGDLHLGQTLRTPTGWLLIDFEGEPARPLEDRRRPDSALRDVAGMLRSFDYAAYHQLADWFEVESGESDNQLVWRAEEWATRNRDAFLDGYADKAELNPRDHPVLLHALELDKAVYEVVYETRHRPTWVGVPLRSLRRLLSAEEHR
ncbi:phosphotransferase [Pseudonocardia eucalypti]|uniref:Maltokinase n=1 Tax=Pseudonocardia eucalypti TaxID=648755 RepID=A0ABP9Q6C4_9PSEU|nr:maltokinase [Pseudonocardia eucalypti]